MPFTLKIINLFHHILLRKAIHDYFTGGQAVTEGHSRSQLGCPCDCLKEPRLSQGWGPLHQFLHSMIFSAFQNYRNIGYLLNIKFIFDRCHCSLAAVTPVKYECDWKDLTGIFAKAGKSLTNKNGALVTPNLESLVWFISRTCIAPILSC